MGLRKGEVSVARRTLSLTAPSLVCPRLELQRKMASPVLSRSRKLRAHRRQLSDPKIHPPFSPITEDRDLENVYDRVSFIATRV